MQPIASIQNDIAAIKNKDAEQSMLSMDNAADKADFEQFMATSKEWQQQQDRAAYQRAQEKLADEKRQAEAHSTEHEDNIPQDEQHQASQQHSDDGNQEKPSEHANSKPQDENNLEAKGATQTPEGEEANSDAHNDGTETKSVFSSGDIKVTLEVAKNTEKAESESEVDDAKVTANLIQTPEDLLKLIEDSKTNVVIQSAKPTETKDGPVKYEAKADAKADAKAELEISPEVNLEEKTIVENLVLKPSDTDKTAKSEAEIKGNKTDGEVLVVLDKTTDKKELNSAEKKSDSEPQVEVVAKSVQPEKVEKITPANEIKIESGQEQDATTTEQEFVQADLDSESEGDSKNNAQQNNQPVVKIEDDVKPVNQQSTSANQSQQNQVEEAALTNAVDTKVNETAKVTAADTQANSQPKEYYLAANNKNDSSAKSVTGEKAVKDSQEVKADVAHDTFAVTGQTEEAVLETRNTGQASSLDKVTENKTTVVNPALAKNEQLTQQAKTEQKQENAKLKDPIPLNDKTAGAAAINDAVKFMVNGRVQAAEIRLDPPELGQIKIKINMNGEQAQVSMVVQNPQAKEMLDQALPKLKELLDSAGIDLGSADIEQQNQQNQQMAGEGGSGNGQGNGSGNGQVDEEIDDMPNEETKIVNGHVGEVDYYA